MTKPLATHAMLATLNVSQWTARKHDKGVSAEVEAQHQAKDAGRYNKLLVDKSALEPMDKVANAARQYHYKVTLPWGDNGDRLLPASLFMDYSDTMRQFKAEFETRVADFVRQYPSLVQAARQRLGTMYEPKDYPANVRDRFDFATSFSPVPTAGDFRVELNAGHVDSIKRDIEQRMNARQTEAVKHCWERVRKVVGNMKERLSTEKGRFHDSLIENARELVDILPALNLTDDPELHQIAHDIRQILVPPDRLRADVTLRAETAKAADAILAKLPWS